MWPQREPPILHVRSCFISKTRSWWVERHCPATTELISPYTLTIQVTPKVLPYSNNSICVITVVQAYLISLLQNIVIPTQIPEGRDTTTFMDCWAWITAWRCNFWPKWKEFGKCTDKFSVSATAVTGWRTWETLTWSMDCALTEWTSCAELEF